MCPACYVPFIAAAVAWIASALGLTLTHTLEFWLGWGIAIFISIPIYFIAKKIYLRYKKKCKIN